jgi:hypothetical protein
MVGLVEEAEGLVRVVCPDAEPAIKARAAAATNIARMFIPFLKSTPCGQSLRHDKDPHRQSRPFLDVNAE